MSHFKHIAILSWWSQNLKTRQANLLTDKIAGSLIWHGWATKMLCLLTVRWNAHPDRFMKQGIPSRNSLFGSWFMLVYGKSYRKHWEIFTAKSPEAAPQDWATPTPWGLWCPSHGPEGSDGQVGCPKWWRFWSWIIWVNYNISLTWIKAIWGWFRLLTMISSEVVVRSL